MKSQDITHLVDRFLVKDHIDARHELAGDGAHGNAVGLASPDLALEVLPQVGVEAAGGVGGRPAGGVEGDLPLRPGAALYRCIVHKVRNVLAKLRVRNKKAFAQDMRATWTARRRREAPAACTLKGKRWVEEERAMRRLEKDLPPCLVYLCFRVEWHKAIRTTNLVERVFREVRRRTRPMGVFGNVEGESVCHAGGDTSATQLLRSPGGVADLRDRHGR
jgi:hypothetical protein